MIGPTETTLARQRATRRPGARHRRAQAPQHRPGRRRVRAGATTICLPAFAIDPDERRSRNVHPRRPGRVRRPGHPSLGRSNVCVAASARAVARTAPTRRSDFGPAILSPSSSSASRRPTSTARTLSVKHGSPRPHGHHEGLPQRRASCRPCPSTNPNGCVVSITPPSKYSTKGHSPRRRRVSGRSSRSRRPTATGTGELAPQVRAVSSDSRRATTAPSITTPPFSSARRRAAV